MLVLSRYKKQAIVAGANGEIRIVVLKIKGNTVSLGIEADRSISINREEVFLKLKAQGVLGRKDQAINSKEGFQ